MDRQYIEDHDVIGRYRRRELPELELEALEVYLIGHPELVAELELDERLAAGLRDLDEAGELGRAGRAGGGGWLTAPRFAAAASVLLAASLLFSGLLYQDNRRLERALGAAPSTTRVYALDVVRAGTAYRSVPAPRADEWLVLLLPLDGDELDYERFAVELRSQATGDIAWAASDLEPDFQDSLSVGLPGQALKPGLYELRITARMADWPAERESVQLSRGEIEMTPVQ